MEDIYCMVEEGWRTQVFTDLYEMLDEQRFCDTKIITADGETLAAHANILAARSKLLAQTFQVSMAPSFKINTEQISTNAWRAILQYMYLGRIETSDFFIQELASVAEILELESLLQLCQERLNKIEAEKNAVKQETMTTMETQTEEEILKFASGEKATLDMYGYSGEEAGTSSQASSYDSHTLSQVSDVTNESQTEEPPQPENVYLMQTDNEANAYVTVAMAPETHQASISHAPSNTSQLSTQTVTPSSIQSPPDSTGRKKRGPQNRILQKDMLFKCGICEKYFSNKQGLERHAILHTQGKAFTCNLCGKAFKLERYLQAHIQRHGEERNFQCPVCGKSFKTQRDASWHTKTVHTYEKKYQCPHCSYAGKTKNLLAQHMFSHTNDKQFVCTTCGKSFLRKQHLMQHMQRHEGRRQYMCSTCGAEFYTIYACKEHHMRIHQGLKKYECSICSQQYNEKKSFMKHLQKHSVDLVLTLDGSDIVIDPNEPIVDDQAEYTVIEANAVEAAGIDNTGTISGVQEDTVVQYHYVQDGAIVGETYIEEAAVS